MHACFKIKKTDSFSWKKNTFSSKVQIFRNKITRSWKVLTKYKQVFENCKLSLRNIYKQNIRYKSFSKLNRT